MWLTRRTRNKSDEEATKALRDAKVNLNKVKRRDKEVNDISNALREIREHDHFAETLEAIILRNGETENDT